MSPEQKHPHACLGENNYLGSEGLAYCSRMLWRAVKGFGVQGYFGFRVTRCSLEATLLAYPNTLRRAFGSLLLQSFRVLCLS